MKQTKLCLLCAIAILAGCASDAPLSTSAVRGRPGTSDTLPAPAASVTAYKVALANHIAAANGERMYAGRPQALLRSVVVVKYVVDGDGRLVRSEIMRSNHDRTTEATALATLRNSAPFPPPAPHLLQRGRLELAETWLFNNDGRFQLRSTAQKQVDE
ncbi:TonB family protein [Janthinobacterium sp. 17J80-10]|uniref:TonB family protein n=1 Tax=Janthinobacterium sp. 17J80-10 TaxID=2497863 RepID=UPI0010054B3F|nr:TonB family protein [Janthinobacterium sp. 17J80-10]QAU32831.1 TonB family protein [Janthinobacterium sp. 17J80-10]